MTITHSYPMKQEKIPGAYNTSNQRFPKSKTKYYSGMMAEGVPTNNQRGQRSGPCRL